VAIDRQTWRDLVDECSAPWRLELAAEHEHRAREIARWGVIWLHVLEWLGRPWEERERWVERVQRSARYHAGRARGLRIGERAADACATSWLTVACRSCEAPMSGAERIPQRCGRITCHACRGLRIARERARLSAGIGAAWRYVLARHEFSRSPITGRRLRPGDRRVMRERFVTLPVPPTRHGIAHDVELAHRARGIFVRSLRHYIARDLGLSERLARIPYFCATEIGTRGILAGRHEGLAHLHIWLIAPFVAWPVVAMLWGRALEAAGHDAVPYVPAQTLIGRCGPWEMHTLATLTRYCGASSTMVPLPMVDVRAVTKANREGVVHELVKYIVKDFTRTEGERIDPASFALVLRARRGRRFIARTARLFTMHREHVCTCGSCSWSVRRWVDGADGAAGLDTSAVTRDGEGLSGRPPPAGRGHQGGSRRPSGAQVCLSL
jgi:hypothetical protein